MSWRGSNIRLLALCSALVASAVAVGMTTIDLRRSMTARGLRYPHADRLVTLVAGSKSWSPGMLESIGSSPLFERLAGIQERAATLQLADHAEVVRLEAVSWTYFDLLGISTSHGRVFSAEEDRRNSTSAVAVVSHSLWQRRLGGALDAVGRTIDIDGRRLEVIGILPAGVTGLIGRSDVWIPLGSARWLMGDTGPERPSSRWFEVFGRLAPDVSIESASGRLEAELPAALSASGIPLSLLGSPMRVAVTPLGPSRVPQAGRRALPVLQAAAGTLSLFVVATIGSLLLLRQQRRSHEVAVQLALGAERMHIIAPAARDGAAIALAGTLLALVLHPMLVAALQQIRRPSNSFGIVTAEWLLPSSPLSMTTAAALALSLVVCVGVSATAAFAALRRAGRASLGTHASGDGLSKPTAPAMVLLAVQTAVACAVLAGALLMTSALSRIIAAYRGYEWDGVFTARLLLPEEYDAARKAALYDALRSRLSELPGVDRASISTCAPGAGRCRQSNISQVDGITLGHGSSPQVGVHTISPDHFAVIRATVILGRAFDASDSATGPWAVMVSDKLANQLWPGVDPIGRQLEVFTANGSLKGLRRVVGTVADIKFNVDADPGLDVYLPVAQVPPAAGVLFINTDRSQRELSAAIAHEVSLLDRRIAVTGEAWLAENLADSLSTEQLVARMLTSFAFIALVLGVLATYTMTAQSVDASRRELAVRLALGATGSQLGRLIGRRGAIAAMSGIVGGTAVALGGARLLSSVVQDTPQQKAVIFAAPLIVVVALAAALVHPIRRAGRINVIQTIGES